MGFVCLFVLKKNRIEKIYSRVQMLAVVGVLVGEGQASWVVKISAVLRVNL